MFFEILQENLATAISQCIKFVSPKAQLPILGNFLIEAEHGIVKICATDMENSIAVFIGAKIEKEGKLTVSAKTFTDFIMALPAGKINVKKEEELLVLESGKNKAKINTMPADEYPKILTSSDGKKLLDLPPAVLKEIAEKLSFAASSDTVSRASMTGVYFDNKEEKFKIVATDGFRLSLLEKTGQKQDFVLNVPVKIIEELGKLAVHEDREIGVYLNENKSQVIFKLSTLEIGSRLIEGKYPPYEKIIPVGFQTQGSLDRADLLRMVKMASVFSKDVSNIVKLSIKDSVLKITAQTPNLGENESEIDIQKKGEDLDVNFNYRYLLDILSRLSSKEIIFESAGEEKPCVFRETDNSSFLHLIMPVKKK